MRSTIISINLRKDEIVIKLNESATQEQIVEGLKKKLTELKKLYKDEKTPIRVTGKILKLINYHEKQNSFGGSFTAGDINY